MLNGFLNRGLFPLVTRAELGANPVLSARKPALIAGFYLLVTKGSLDGLPLFIFVFVRSSFSFSFWFWFKVRFGSKFVLVFVRSSFSFEVSSYFTKYFLPFLMYRPDCGAEIRWPESDHTASSVGSVVRSSIPSVIPTSALTLARRMWPLEPE